MKNIFTKFLFYLCFLLSCKAKTDTALTADTVPKYEKWKGLNFVAVPSPFSESPMLPVKNIGAGWIAAVPYAFTTPDKPAVTYNTGGWQWWGERPEGVRTTIRLAHAEGLKVMLKPQVYVPGSWTGGLDFATDADWEAWEKSYENYLLPFAVMADSMGVEAICVGTEFKISAQKREKFWRQLIQKIRSQYKGKLTYSANWDEYAQIPFWDALDMVGISAYFPLIADQTPSVKDLETAWQPHKERIKAFSEKINRPILFTEYGYMSIDGCAGKIWEVEQVATTLPVNQRAQSNALLALWRTFGNEKYWLGGFLWKWFPNMQGHEGYPERDYTPQGKLAESELQKIWK